MPGAKVMTTFGVFGTVLSIDEENNQVTIESGPGTVLRVHRQAIGRSRATRLQSQSTLPEPPLPPPMLITMRTPTTRSRPSPMPSSTP